MHWSSVKFQLSFHFYLLFAAGEQPGYQDHSGVCGPASGLLAHGAGVLAATTVLPGNCVPASGLLARGAGALAATASLPGYCGPASGPLAGYINPLRQAKRRMS